MMNEILTESSAHAYYLIFQIVVSVALAVVGWVIGSIFAWMIWGRSKSRVTQLEKKVAELRAIHSN